MGSTVKELIQEINESREKARQDGITTYDTKSKKDELNIMKAMLNDTSYSVGIYGPGGLKGEYCPALEIRNTLSNIIQNVTGIGKTEADLSIKNYEFESTDARGLIDFSKEFINTYLQTGRKLPLGGREKSNVSLIKKTIPSQTMLYPAKVKKDPNDSTPYESKEVFVEEYDTIRVYGSCPEWIERRKV